MRCARVPRGTVAGAISSARFSYAGPHSALPPVHARNARRRSPECQHAILGALVDAMEAAGVPLSAPRNRRHEETALSTAANKHKCGYDDGCVAHAQ